MIVVFIKTNFIKIEISHIILKKQNNIDEYESGVSIDGILMRKKCSAQNNLGKTHGWD